MGTLSELVWPYLKTYDAINLTNATGPSEITVYHPDVFMAIDGPQGGCVKSEWYDLLHPKQSLVTARNKEAHGTRRRQWNRGFSSQGMYCRIENHHVDNKADSHSP